MRGVEYCAIHGGRIRFRGHENDCDGVREYVGGGGEGSVSGSGVSYRKYVKLFFFRFMRSSIGPVKIRVSKIHAHKTGTYITVHTRAL